MYCSVSTFWQHFDGQQPGQQQQQSRQDHIKIIKTSPMAKAPTNIPYAVDWLVMSVIAPLELPERSLLMRVLLI